MPDQIVQGRKLYVGGRDLSGDWTAISLKAGREPIDFTRGSDTTRVMKSGLRVVSFEAEGIANLGPDLADEELYLMADTLADQPIIVAPTTGAEGEPAYGFRADIGDFEPFADAQVGDRLNFRVSARAHGSKVVRGTVMADAATARQASFDGTARQLGAVASGKKLYACLMVLGASGTSPTLDGKIQSDDASGFASPTDVTTFSQKTAAGQFEWTEISGPVTDDHFRFSATIGGTSPSFTIVVLTAIG